MATIAAAQKQAEQTLRNAGIDSARLDSWLLLEKVSGKARAWLLAHGDEALTPKAEREFTALVARRAGRIPLVHLTNHREFYGLDLYIDERVLTPRVETEKIAEYAIARAPQNSRLIDVGTGSGALALAIKQHRPDLEVWETDVSAEAMVVAECNAQALQLEIKRLTSDLFDTIPAGTTFQTVVTNLPYLRDDARAELMPEVQKEPSVALFGGSDGLDIYRRFLQQLPTFLAPGGYLFTECDPWQHAALIKEAAAAGLRPIEQHDYFILGFQRG